MHGLRVYFSLSCIDVHGGIGFVAGLGWEGNQLGETQLFLHKMGKKGRCVSRSGREHLRGGRSGFCMDAFL